MNIDEELIIQNYWMQHPFIPVKEISRILINLRKQMVINDKFFSNEERGAIDCCISQVRHKLALRSRSRKGVVRVQKNIRGNRKVHSKAK